MRKLTLLILPILIVLLPACGALDKLSNKVGAQDVIFLNADGDLVLVDGGKPKIIPPCDASDRKGFPDCTIPFDLATVKEDANQVKENLEQSCKSKNCKVLNVKSLLVVDYPGSTCRLIYDRANNITFEVCR